MRQEGALHTVSRRLAANFLVLIVAFVFGAMPATAFSATFTATGAPAVVLEAAANIPNLHQVDENFYRGGMPNQAGLRQLRDAGVKTVISLANEKKYLASEKEAVKELGMTFVHIPMSAWRKPKQNDIDAFMAVVQDKDEEPVFVHCVHGRDRTGAMVAMYRIQEQGWSAEQAYGEMVDKGFRKFFLALKDMVFDLGEEIAEKRDTAA
jgi:tyrosine-protein phosphatase SIW14